jgi:pilus assembly protein HofM
LIAVKVTADKEIANMAFRCWQVGLHIQHARIAIVALQRERVGWALRRWWSIPLPDGAADRGIVIQPDRIVNALKSWRRELPLQHQVAMAFPASRTLQKAIPRPAMALRERDSTHWVASNMAKRMEMDAAALCFDYAPDEAQREYRVTVAQQRDVVALYQVAQRLTLQVTAITPDASALRYFLPYLTEPGQAVVWRDDDAWLWATSSNWGTTGFSQAATFSDLLSHIQQPLTRCTAQTVAQPSVDPWSTIVKRQPPLPPDSDAFAVAIALALGANAW